MSASVINLFGKRAEFDQEPPSETLINLVEQVCSASLYTGEARYSEKTQYKFINCISGLGYGGALFELTHLLYFLVTEKIEIHDFLVSEDLPVNFIKKHSLENNTQKNTSGYVNDHIAINISSASSFKIYFSRLGLLSALLEFLYHSVGLGKINFIVQQLEHQYVDNQLIKKLTNELSSSLYEFLKEHIPVASIRSKSSKLSEYLIQKGKKNSFSSSDLSDELILEFWKLQSLVQDTKFKLYATCADSWISYGIGLDMMKYSGFQDAIGFHLSKKNGEEFNFLDSYEPSQSFADLMDKEEHIADAMERLSSENGFSIKFLNKKELSQLAKIKLFDNQKFKLPLSALRKLAFSSIQSQIVEASRKKQGTKKMNELNDKFSHNDYRLIYDELSSLNERCLSLSKVACFRLWEESDPLTLHLMFEIETESNVSTLKVLMRDFVASKKYGNNLDVDNPEQIALQFLGIKHKKIEEIYDDYRSSSLRFKRQGLTCNSEDPKAKAVWKQEMLEGAESLIQIREFLNKFLDLLRDNEVYPYFGSTFFEKDKTEFFIQFKKLYG